MRWRATIWLGIALATATCEYLTIDNSLPGHNGDERAPEMPVSGIEQGEIGAPEGLPGGSGDTGNETPEGGDPSGNSGDTDSGNGDTGENPPGDSGDIDSEDGDSGKNPPGDSGDIESEDGDTDKEPPDASCDTDTEPPGAIGDTDKESPENCGTTETEPPTEGTTGSPVPIPIDPESDEAVIEVTKTVRTDAGYVSGFYTHVDTTKIENFIDIPYGTFTGLFSAPTNPPPWGSVRHINEHNKRCPQLQDDVVVGDIDCLTLSVFVPHGATNAPVLLHIHDSNFVSGSGDPALYGPKYLVPKGVILVLPNYRLGPLGFLCMQNAIVPGNAALKDLTLALSWTQRNIEQFGGDPSNIVVSGDGSSGALVGYLALSPKSREYIKGVIMESGSVLSHWALDRDPTAAARSMARTIRPHSRNVLRVYENIDVQTLLRSARNTRFKPCIESDNGTDAFLNETPWTILNEEGWESNIAFMIGSANHAGMHEALGHTADSLTQLNEDFSTLLPNDLKFETSEEKSEVGERVKEKYFGESTVSLQELEKLSTCYTDADYLGPAIRTARPLVNAGASVYLYEFSFVGELNREHHALTNPVEGAARGDIVGYIFTQDGVTPEEDTEEYRMVDLMTNLWVQFITTGNPSIEGIQWNKLEKVEDPSEEQWLLIAGPDDVTLQDGLHVDRLQLWTELYEEHFVEHNLALGLEPSYRLYHVLVPVIFLLGSFKESFRV